MPYAWEHLTPAEKTAILRSIADGGAPPPPPRVVELSWQDRCNIDCFFCSTAEIRAGNFELSRERLEALFAEMAALGVRGVRLMGGGEPLFRKDAEPLIRSLGAHGLRIADVTTNGVLLTEPVVRALYAAGCDEICISLNTADPESYGAMMQTTPKNYGRVLDNVRRAAAIKREVGAACRIRLQFLIYQDNYRQLPRMAEVFRESGADAYWLNGLYPVRPMPTMSEDAIAEMLRLYEGVLAGDYFEHLERFSFWEQSIADRIDASTRAVFARAPLARRARTRLRHIAAGGARRAAESARLHEFCLVGWYSMTVNANGDAVTCCILQDHGTAVLGSIHGSSLGEIWNGAAYARFRGELREIMARRGAVEGGDFARSCSVEPLCAQKDACPNRSYYWAGDLPFRREFHAVVEALPRPEGDAFAGLTGGRPRSAPTRLPALPVR
ncbi:MAG TPA: radical SAM protein [Thermoanaerobaculia bacterium]